MSRRGVGISLRPYLTVVSYWPGVVAHRQPESNRTRAPFVTEDADFAMNLLLAVLLGAVALLAIAIWSIKRHKDPHLELDTDAGLDQLICSLSGITLGMPLPGNAVEVFENGAFFQALVRDIAAAQRTVHFETFLWKEGALGERIADALCAAARAGLEVRVVLDAVGCKKMGKAARQKMDDAGCQI